MKRSIIKLVILGTIASVLYVFLGPYLNLTTIQANQIILKQFCVTYPLWSYGGYMVSYVILTSIGLPVTALYTIAAGFLFGSVNGLIVVLFSFLLHCMASLLLVRYVLKELIQGYFSERLAKINEGIKKRGLYYLFVLRVSMITPSFFINCACGMTDMKIGPFTVVSVLSSIPIITILVFSGKMIGEIQSIWDLYNPVNLAVLVGLLVFAIGLTVLKRRREG